MRDHSAFIIARNREHAHRTAVIDWGWRAVAFDAWQRPDGLTVRFAGHADALRGAPRNTVVFLGNGWWESPISGPRGGDALLGRLTVARDPHHRVAG